MDALKTHTFAQPERHPLMDYTNETPERLDYSTLELHELFQLRDAHTLTGSEPPLDLDATIIAKGGILE